jgi:diaminopropionate ammonia-lyase
MADVMTTRWSDGWLVRPAARCWRCPAPSTAARAFHASLPGYAVTALVDVPALAGRWGVGGVLVKNESSRLGLSAFKVLGASWAVARLVGEGAGLDVEDLRLDGLRAVAGQAPVTLVTATDGNHGRALARVGSWLGLPVEVVVPAVISRRAETAIAAEGARVTRIAGSYDEAVGAAAELADRMPSAVLVQDTGWDGYEVVPGWIVEGYQTLLSELDDQLADIGLGGPDMIAVPVGVGSLAQAVVAYARGRSDDAWVRVLACEPDTAACVLASLSAGNPVSVATGATVMAGLNCGTPSSLAWPLLRNGLDAAIAVSDDAAITAVAALADYGVQAGASGAAALAGATACLDDPARRAELDLRNDAVVVLLNTEGADGDGGAA